MSFRQGQILLMPDAFILHCKINTAISEKEFVYGFNFINFWNLWGSIEHNRFDNLQH